VACRYADTSYRYQTHNNIDIIKYNKLIHSTIGKNNDTHIWHHTADKL